MVCKTEKCLSLITELGTKQQALSYMKEIGQVDAAARCAGEIGKLEKDIRSKQLYTCERCPLKNAPIQS